MATNDQRPADLAAIKAILSIWKIVASLTGVFGMIGLLVLWMGHAQNRIELVLIGCGIEALNAGAGATIFGVLLFRVSVWHDQQTKPTTETKPSGDPVGTSA